MDLLVVSEAMRLAMRAIGQIEAPIPGQEAVQGADGLVSARGRRYRVAVRVVVEDVGSS